jgi:hypothetical protein
VVCAQLAFWYEAEIRRRHRSKSERRLFEAEAFVWIPEASRAQVRVVHRLPYEESNLEILSFANRLWWPLELPKFGLGHLTTADLSKLLHERSVDLLGISPRDPPRFADRPLDQDLTIKEVIENRREAVLNAANRKIADNLLIVDGYSYVRGGPPVHILGAAGRFINPGAGRFIDHGVDGLRYHSLLGADDVVVRALRRGRFRVAHRFANDQNTRPEPKIADFSVAEIRVDTCLRDLWHLLISRGGFVFDGRTLELDQDFRLLKEQVDFLVDAAPEGDPLTITYERLQALHRFVIFTERWKTDFGQPRLTTELAEAADELAYFGDRNGVNRARHLDWIDDEAIAKLALTLY